MASWVVMVPCGTWPEVSYKSPGHNLWEISPPYLGHSAQSLATLEWDSWGCGQHVLQWLLTHQSLLSFLVTTIISPSPNSSSSLWSGVQSYTASTSNLPIPRLESRSGIMESRFFLFGGIGRPDVVLGEGGGLIMLYSLQGTHALAGVDLVLDCPKHMQQWMHILWTSYRVTNKLHSHQQR